MNYFLFSRYAALEEYNAISHDKYGRCIPQTSQYNSLDPTVSNDLLQSGCVFDYPNNKTFAVCLTHDVDFIQQKRLLLTRKNIQVIIKKDDYNNFDQIIRLEDKYNAKSTFFVLLTPEIRHNKNIFLELIRSGSDVQLHINNYLDVAQEQNNFKKLFGYYSLGCRVHYLKFVTPTTWELLADEFSYDATYGYASTIGWRNGLCHPFIPYNNDTEKIIPILELQTNIMDATLFDYMQLDIHNAWIICKYLIDITKKYHGVLTILWHNSSFDKQKTKLYEKILEYCSDGWLTNCTNIYKWFYEHDYDRYFEW